jgi:hypothetical protein
MSFPYALFSCQSGLEIALGTQCDPYHFIINVALDFLPLRTKPDGFRVIGAIAIRKNPFACGKVEILSAQAENSYRGDVPPLSEDMLKPSFRRGCTGVRLDELGIELGRAIGKGGLTYDRNRCGEKN